MHLLLYPLAHIDLIVNCYHLLVLWTHGSGACRIHNPDGIQGLGDGGTMCDIGESGKDVALVSVSFSGGLRRVFVYVPSDERETPVATTGNCRGANFDQQIGCIGRRITSSRRLAFPTPNVTTGHEFGDGTLVQSVMH